MKRQLGFWGCIGLGSLLASCGGESAPPPPPPGPGSGTTVSSSIALSKDDKTLWVVNQDDDSVSVIDTEKRSLVDEIALGSTPPSVDPMTQRYEPTVMPRALAIVDEKKVYVAGEASNRVYVVDAAAHSVITSIPVPAAPVSIAAMPDGSAVFVVSHEAAVVTK